MDRLEQERAIGGVRTSRPDVIERTQGCIDGVSESVNTCLELLDRLRQMNLRLRGPKDNNINEAGKTTAPQPDYLGAHVNNLHQVLKHCHAELSETYNILGI